MSGGVDLKAAFWISQHQQGKRWLQKPIIFLMSKLKLPIGIAAELSWWLPYRDKLPLVDERHKLILFHSPKAAGGTAIKWFFQSAGKLEEALEYGNWVHTYVNEHYYENEQLFVRFPSMLCSKHYRKLKVVRNPYSRFISSAYHFVKHQQHYVNDLLPQDFSATDFIDLLLEQPRAFVNPHFAPQYSGWEVLYPHLLDEVVHLEEIESRLNALNQQWELNTPFEESFIERRHAIEGTVQYQSADLHRLPLKELLKNPPTDISAFYADEPFRKKVWRFYEQDFTAYGYAADKIPSR